MLYGTSTRYDMAGSFNGHASWVYDRTTNVLRDVSLTDQEHISSTGFRSTGRAAGEIDLVKTIIDSSSVRAVLGGRKPALTR